MDSPLALLRTREPHPSETRYRLTATTNLVVALSFGLVCAVGVGARACAVREQCASEQTCTVASHGLCSFTNAATLASTAVYNANGTANALGSTLRSVCSPGDRLQRSTITEAVECVPFYPYPSSLNVEIMNPAATKPHARACGKWIDSGSVLGTKVVKRSTQDHGNWLDVLQSAEDTATRSPRNAKDAMSKFRAECMRTTHQGPAAVQTALVMAYKYLTAQLGDVVDERSFLRASGVLAGHFCDSSVRVGTGFTTSGFHVAVGEGWTFGHGVLSQALQIVSEDSDVQVEAERANGMVNSHAARGTATLDAAQIAEVLVGAMGDTGKSAALAGADATTKIGATLQAYRDEPSKMVSYLKGAAAYCSFAVQSNIESAGGSLATELSRIKSARVHAEALTRLSTSSLENIDVTTETSFDASSATLSQVSTPTTGDSATDCLQFMRALFPSDVDAARFDATLDRRLYDRLEPLVAQIREGVATAMQASPLKEALLYPARVAADVRAAGVRIAGAPRGTWAGIGRAIPDAGIDSSDGLFTQALKQSRAVFKDHLNLAYNNVPACDHPPFWRSTTLNAYMLYTLKCTVLFQGLAHRPWLDSNYDDASLLSKGGMVIGHELSHLTLNVPFTPEYDTLLKRYQPSTRVEAIADLGAVLGILSIPGMVKDDVLMNFCQAFCARVPFLWQEATDTTHPQNNQRCDFLVATVSDF